MEAHQTNPTQYNNHIYMQVICHAPRVLMDWNQNQLQSYLKIFQRIRQNLARIPGLGSWQSIWTWAVQGIRLQPEASHAGVQQLKVG